MVKTCLSTFLAIVLTTLQFVSCTVEKRVHLSGYHVDWKKTNKRQIRKIHRQKSDFSIADRRLEGRVDQVSNLWQELGSIGRGPGSESKKSLNELGKVGKKANRVDRSASSRLSYSYNRSPRRVVGKSLLKRFQPRPDNEERKQSSVEGFGLTSMIVGIVGWVAPAASAGLLLVLAIVFGVVGLLRFNKDPDRFNGQGFAIAGIVLGLVGIAVLAILL